jgi:hypothetical protein
MINGIGSTNSLFGSANTSLLSSLGGVSPFGSVFDQAMTQATTPQKKAEVLLAKAKFQNQLSLSSMFSDLNNSSPSYNLGSLFGTNSSQSLPSWAYELQRLLGNNQTVKDAISLSQTAAALNQLQYNNSLANLGLGGSVDTLL